ncbi:hypothetical protein Tco_0992704 [Tanacetum coccineum]|uniref:Uncharacterized protein n=1 Tax=Tanacetum coccineum TaxID=301880 RepID=A0ABQ5F377_9ASTR
MRCLHRMRHLWLSIAEESSGDWCAPPPPRHPPRPRKLPFLIIDHHIITTVITGGLINSSAISPTIGAATAVEGWTSMGATFLPKSKYYGYSARKHMVSRWVMVGAQDRAHNQGMVGCSGPDHSQGCWVLLSAQEVHRIHTMNSCRTSNGYPHHLSPKDSPSFGVSVHRGKGDSGLCRRHDLVAVR